MYSFFNVFFFFHYGVVSTELFHRRECVLKIVNRGVKGGEQNFEFCYVAPCSVGFGKNGEGVRDENYSWEKKTVRFAIYDHKGRYIVTSIPPLVSQISKSNEPFMNAFLKIWLHSDTRPLPIILFGMDVFLDRIQAGQKPWKSQSIITGISLNFFLFQ